MRACIFTFRFPFNSFSFDINLYDMHMKHRRSVAGKSGYRCAAYGKSLECLLRWTRPVFVYGLQHPHCSRLPFASVVVTVQDSEFSDPEGLSLRPPYN